MLFWYQSAGLVDLHQTWSGLTGPGLELDRLLTVCLSSGLGGLRPPAGLDPERHAARQHPVWEAVRRAEVLLRAGGLRPDPRPGGPAWRGPDRDRREGTTRGWLSL